MAVDTISSSNTAFSAIPATTSNTTNAVTCLLNPSHNPQYSSHRHDQNPSVPTHRHRQVVVDRPPKRKRISPEQLYTLTKLFESTDTPSHEQRERLAKQLQMTNREVQVWFQNRRAKANRLRQQALRQQKVAGYKSKVIRPKQWSSFRRYSYVEQHRMSLSSPATSHIPLSPPSPPHMQYEPLYHRSIMPRHVSPDTMPVESNSYGAMDTSLYGRDREEEENSITASSSSAESTPIGSTRAYSIHVTAIDILATAAEYVQRWDEEEERKKRQMDASSKSHESWRPWLI